MRYLQQLKAQLCNGTHIQLCILRISIGVIYLWFGALKFFSGVSPAEDLATNTIHVLTMGILPDTLGLVLLAIWETLVGVLLILNFKRRVAIYAAMVHMVCTFLPLAFFPELSFGSAPLSFTLVGQYILKNLVILSALLILLPGSVPVQRMTAARK